MKRPSGGTGAPIGWRRPHTVRVEGGRIRRSFAGTSTDAATVPAREYGPAGQRRNLDAAALRRHGDADRLERTARRTRSETAVHDDSSPRPGCGVRIAKPRCFDARRQLLRFPSRASHPKLSVALRCPRDGTSFSHFEMKWRSAARLPKTSAGDVGKDRAGDRGQVIGSSSQEPPMSDLPPVSHALDDAIRRAIDSKTKPLGALGAVESLAARIARVQGTLTPDLHRCRLTLFAGDHGIAHEGVSAYPQAVTRQMVANFLAGGAARQRVRTRERRGVARGGRGRRRRAHRRPRTGIATDRRGHAQLRGRAGDDGGAVRCGVARRRRAWGERRGGRRRVRRDGGSRTRRRPAWSRTSSPASGSMP